MLWESVVLDKMKGLGGLFGQKIDHPLANPRELKQTLDALPKDNAFKALDEIAGWLESLPSVSEFPVDRLYDAVRQLEEAAYPSLRRLAREYLHTPRLNKPDEKRLWAINHGFWTLLAAAYERCVTGMSEPGKPAEALKPLQPALYVRLLAAYGAIQKWEQFHYGPTPADLWGRIGKVMQQAEAAGVAIKSVSLGGALGVTSPAQEFQKLVVFQAASMDSLLPFEIDIAEHLIAHFLPNFVFTADALHDSVYWLDLQLAQPPLRLARMPAQASPSQRFFKPGPAHAEIRALLDSLARGDDLPAEINLGSQFQNKVLLPVLQHLALYLAPIPPQRKHDRHRVKHRMSVLNGLVNAFVAFSGEFGGRPAGLQMESWVVENVSRGGFGALVPNLAADWLKVGALLALQPEGGENWLLGIIRRYHRTTENEARVGIEALARQVVSVEAHVRSASSYAAVAGIPALLALDPQPSGDTLVVLPPATFDLRENLEFTRDGRRQALAPVALVEQTADYELARYRLSVIG